MKIHKRLYGALLFLAATFLASSIPAFAFSSHSGSLHEKNPITTNKICEYEDGPRCTGWYPNYYTCAGIVTRTDVELWKKYACAAWAGVERPR